MLCSLSWAGLAQADELAASGGAQVQASAGSGQGAQASASASTGTPGDDDPTEEEESDDDPMGSLGLTLKAGYLHYGSAHYKYVSPIQGLTVVPPDGAARSAPTVSLDLNLGSGSGLAWDFEAYVMFEQSPVIGGYTGPALQLHFNHLYLSVGAGLRLGVWTDSSVQRGLDIFGRFPIKMTYYVADNLGLVFEFGFGWGGTGIKQKNPMYNASNVPPQLLNQVSSYINGMGFFWGRAATLDASIGLRFP